MKGAYNRLLFVLRMSLSLCLSITQFSEQAGWQPDSWHCTSINANDDQSRIYCS